VQAGLLEKILPIDGMHADAGHRALAGKRKRDIHSCRTNAPDLAKKIRKAGDALVRNFHNQVAGLYARLLRGPAAGEPGYHHVSLYLGCV
jgi:hypothetical protein